VHISRATSAAFCCPAAFLGGDANHSADRRLPSIVMPGAALPGDMRRSSKQILSAGLAAIACLSFFSLTSGARSELTSSASANLHIDYPLEGSIFPPEITPPTFLWHDRGSATLWVVEVSFKSNAPKLRIETSGPLLQMGELDPRAGTGDEVTPLTPEQAATHTWKPDAATWEKIKSGSVKHPASITIEGFVGESAERPVSIGRVDISTSVDPVGAPIFYRDVPLLLSSPGEKGVIQPLPPSAIPLIEWRIRNVADTQSKTAMRDLPTCANCHSFSTDGKTLGIDVDGPKNDKGLYALAPVAKEMTIRNQDVIRWSSFQEDVAAQTSEPAVKRFGFMSQVSPDGRYVVTSIGPPGAKDVHHKENPNFAAGLSDRLFSTVYKDISFLQVFYPTRGILAWYDRQTAKLKPLPGADDPNYVQTSAFWTPDGKYLIFSRARESDPYPPGATKPTYANDPNEPQVQYDLYRIPFNQGRGGKPEPIAGASGNGMSNNFPKVSPDGRWIVFVQNHNGLLMRPDSRLFIVPSTGGKARLMDCNTARMNSWHSFSPNGHWLAFSSKGRSIYTQLMLTHIDADGNDSPAVLVENTTAGNRAVNIPEFVNVPADGLEKINPQATEFYRIFNHVFELMENNRMAEAIPELRRALELDPNDALAHFSLATALTANGQEREAVEEYRGACALDDHHATWFHHYAVSLALNGKIEEAVLNWRKSLALDPTNAEAESNLGAALFAYGRKDEGFDHLQKAVTMAPSYPDGHSQLGWALAQLGKANDAIDELRKAVSLKPDSIEYRYNLGFVLGSQGDTAGSIDAFQKAVALSGAKEWRCLAALAEAYRKAGRSSDAVRTAQLALEAGHQEHDAALDKKLRDDLDRYQRELANSSAAR
jgi:Flp pilus assembly protein TadD